MNLTTFQSFAFSVGGVWKVSLGGFLVHFLDVQVQAAKKFIKCLNLLFEASLSYCQVLLSCLLDVLSQLCILFGLLFFYLILLPQFLVLG
jgi:hypothetical protein